ncbi:NAD(P)-dependent oxidoreductase [Bacteroides sp. 519]|uniref:NAD-dependent epimerase/dehydratase family protein n=1 Tax=Bacteroides sp. 519 TaxID=2302937 RepID=UPI0013D864EE|nr:NAD(P)-dependent oxidoreductase [Bacteroides sp. 519]
MAKSILITGASGFIGSFIVQEAVKRKYNVWAGIRSSSSKEYLTDRKIHFLELDFAHPNELRAQLSGYKGTYNKFDYIIHCAGLTKTNNSKNFEKVNYLQTKYFIDTLKELNMVPQQFVYISTLSIFGPIHETDYAPIRETDVPAPNTDYGLSKLKAELYIQSIPGFPYVFYRPTGVYGPRERDYYLMAKSIKKHFDFSVGFKRQDLTFVYVNDLVNAIFLGIDKNISRRAYTVTDGSVYQSSTFADLIKKELGSPFVFHIKCPLFILKAISLLAEFYANLSGNSSTLNSDKYKIMKQRNWQCDISPLIDELGYTPEYNLEAGVKETIAWYKQKEWL